ncbi:MAG: hypothetical protein CMJ89_15240 [Planctomycetes bacterium]|jgi:type II secretory pathway pseudopilin PulG|nr:hypothetical protein [Planctomycetota bacterium]
MNRPGPTPGGARSGFTLAEVAVTLLIVSFALVLVLQGLNTSKFSAAQTHNRKVARELALLSLGRVEAGLYWEELDGEGDKLHGTYAEEGYEDWRWELGFGEDNRPQEYAHEEETGYWDNWAWEREQEQERLEEEGLDDEEAVSEPYEEVYITVLFPRLGEYPNQVTIERWIPWMQVYGINPDQEEASEEEEFLPPN